MISLPTRLQKLFSSTVVFYECRNCGTTLNDHQPECPECGSTDTVCYELE